MPCENMALLSHYIEMCYIVARCSRLYPLSHNTTPQRPEQEPDQSTPKSGTAEPSIYARLTFSFFYGITIIYIDTDTDREYTYLMNTEQRLKDLELRADIHRVIFIIAGAFWFYDFIYKIIN